jgi:hypothetical protein
VVAGEAHGHGGAQRRCQIAWRLGNHQRVDHVARTSTYRPRIEAARHRRQQPDIGESRVAAADARMVIEDRDAVRLQQRAQPVGLAGDSRLRDAEEHLGHTALESAFPDGCQRCQRLH